MAMALAALAVPSARADVAVPITLTGWNADVVTDANPATRFAVGFDAGTPGVDAGSWFEAGAGGHADGLPSGQNFSSAIIDPVTGGPTTFHLQPANGNNVLQLGGGHPASNTLTLATPGTYSSLSILAASGSSFGLTTGTLVLHFTDGTSSSLLSYNAFDWSAVTAGVGPFVALGGVARNFDVGTNGTGFIYYRPHEPPYALYETDINLAALGLAGRDLQSITFNEATGPSGVGSTGIFAVSGVAVPEPSTLALLVSGGLGLASYRLRRRRS
jgi:hypothetical protein